MTKTLYEVSQHAGLNPYQFSDDSFGDSVDDSIAENPRWDDLRFPFVGRNLDTASGRLDYNFYNAGVGFQNNARFNVSEAVVSFVQMPHQWLEGSSIRPHLHWLQQGSDEPNWLLAYKMCPKEDQYVLETTFNNHTLLTKSGNAFTYTSGAIHQITTFPEIDMTGMSLSDCLAVAIFRDSGNASGEFAGSDPSGITELAWEWDIHYQIDSNGSTQEFIK